MTLGICDWGIGGLGLYDLLKRSRPGIGVTYIGDQGSAPYNLLSRPEMAERVQQVLETFGRLGVNRVVFASDEASTSLCEVSVPGVVATGVIDPTLRSMKGRKYREVGIIGGRRTVLSGAYGRALRKLHFCVLQRMSEDLPIAIEQGWATEVRTRELLAGVLEPLVKSDCLLLGCTHFRLVGSIIRDILPDADIVDPVEPTVAELLAVLPEKDDAESADVFFSTGDAKAMRRRAQETYGLDITVEPLAMVARDIAAYTA